MSTSLLLVVLLALSGLAWHLGRRRSLVVARGAGGPRALHSRPVYYGSLTALAGLVPALLVVSLWLIISPHVVDSLVIASLPKSIQALPADPMSLMLNDIHLAAGNPAALGAKDPDVLAGATQYRRYSEISNWLMVALALLTALSGAWLAWRRIHVELRARNVVEKLLTALLFFSSTIAVLTTAGIVLSVLFETLRFLDRVPLSEFLFGLHWSPQTAIRADQVGSSGAFGSVPLMAGTWLITLIAMAVAVPIGLTSAIYLSEFASRPLRARAKPVLEILAGIPTVVYGFFAALTVAPFIRGVGESMGLEVSSESALAAGLVMGIMIIPYVSSLSDDAIAAVPDAMRDGSLALGATRTETVFRVIVPAALPGIAGGVLLAVSRAIGETMIVVMAAGLSANLTANPLQAVTTVTVQIVTLLVGDQEFDSSKTLAAFALGLLLFLTTLVLNVMVIYIVRRYREQYE